MMDAVDPTNLSGLWTGLDHPLERRELAARGERDILRPVHERRKGRGAAPVGVQPRDQRPVSGTNGLLTRARFQPKDLISLVFAHFSGGRARISSPRLRIDLHVLTPTGRAAVEIIQNQRKA